MYTITLYNGGPLPVQLMKILREYQPLWTMEKLKDTALTETAKEVAVLYDPTTVINCLHRLAGVGAVAVCRGPNGQPPEFLRGIQFRLSKGPATSKEVLDKIVAARIERESKLDPVLTEYYRAVMPVNDVPEDLMAMRHWAEENLYGLFRIRKALIQNAGFYTVETTSFMDSMYVKMRWSDHFYTEELNSVQMEWLWDKPSRLFGDNPPCLAHLVSTGQIIHPSGTPYSFAEGVDVSYKAPVEIVTKGQFFALAPNESQREIFVKYCEDYDVLVHFASEPFSDTVVDDVLFNTVVSVDPDKAESFQAVWASAFERFNRDASARSIVAVAQATT